MNYNGADSLVVTVSDGGQTGIANPASPSTITRTVTVTVNPMNDPPQVTVPGGLTVAEDASAYFAAIQVSDVDAGENAGATVRVTLTVDNGVLLVSTGIPGGLNAGNVSNNNSRNVTLTGTLAAMNTTLSNAAGVLYRPTANFFGSDTGQRHGQRFGQHRSTGAQTAVSSFTVTVTPVNDAPLAVNDPGLGDPPLTVNEDTVLNVAGRGVLDNDLDVDGDDLGGRDRGGYAGRRRVPHHQQPRCAGRHQRGGRHVHFRSDPGGRLPTAARRADAHGHLHLQGVGRSSCSRTWRR